MIQQLLRECSPGYGGVERVAHSVADALGGSVFHLRRPRAGDPWPVAYRRCWLPSWGLGQVIWPLPSRALGSLLISPQPLIAHLPCPTVLALLLLARILRPHRPIRVYWHAFLQPRTGWRGGLERLYQAVALLVVRCFPVVTTSPPLRQALIQAGLASERVACLPCSLPVELEAGLLAIARSRVDGPPAGRLISIGRLDSYKRIDWLLRAMGQTPAIVQLDVVGEGPLRAAFETLAPGVVAAHQRVVFHGRLSEDHKASLLAQADLLVLPADRCNEAFGLVQLEAMASGIPALAYNLPRSGMHWVSALPACPWDGEPGQLAATLQQLLTDPPRYRLACEQARLRYRDHFATAPWQHRCRALLGVHG